MTEVCPAFSIIVTVEYVCITTGMTESIFLSHAALSVRQKLLTRFRDRRPSKVIKSIKSLSLGPYPSGPSAGRDGHVHYRKDNI